MSDLGSFKPDIGPRTGGAHLAGLVNDAERTHDHGRPYTAQDLAALKAIRPSRFAGLRRLLGRRGRRGG